jgi:hypothetical protein
VANDFSIMANIKGCWIKLKKLETLVGVVVLIFGAKNTDWIYFATNIISVFSKKIQMALIYLILFI